MTTDQPAALAEAFPALRAALEAVADPNKVEGMEAYQKNQFRFLGVTSPNRKRAQKQFVQAGKGCSARELLDAADRCWAQPEREFQYVGADLLRRWANVLTAADIDRVERLIVTKSWWDTVDALAAHVVGPIVLTDRPLLAAVLDRWLAGDDMWLARTSILHQLTYKDATDPERLFGACDARGSSSEFFIRKALGWALRQYARTDPEAVRAYVDAYRERLSGLTIHE
ncbi:MAG: DNA alkylation repair protein, partial [Acidimicrobiales bacterium]|nr:DNA alkylation repair protein [Acidimicrobiales bacterium]